MERDAAAKSATFVQAAKTACTTDGKLVIASGSQVKLMGQNADMSLFSNYPSAMRDQVFLNINSKDLRFLTEHTDVKTATAMLVPFYKQVAASFDGQRARVAYMDALLAVQVLLQACKTQYEHLEELAYQV